MKILTYENWLKRNPEYYEKSCFNCHNGQIECKKCRGEGVLHCAWCDDGCDMCDKGEIHCYDCDGTLFEDCHHCNGTGELGVAVYSAMVIEEALKLKAWAGDGFQIDWQAHCLQEDDVLMFDFIKRNYDKFQRMGK